MSIELGLVIAYLALCIVVGVVASRRVLSSGDDYWVAGRSIGTVVNATAIMATLASGGSLIGVMGLTYKQGIPATLALFAGAVIGFPLASILVARPLRNFGRYTIADFLGFRYPHASVRYLVPLLIVASFTAYIVAQMKAAGITANLLLGIPYEVALTLSAIVFILYVSVGGMVAVTWTDVVQGALMLAVVVGTAVAMISDAGSAARLLANATTTAPELGIVADKPVSSYLGSFLIWATAIPVIPHIVMRVFAARDAHGARLSLNLAMVAYAVIILAAVFVIAPAGKTAFPNLEDADAVFLRVMQSEFGPVTRGIAVAAVMAAVMSTTDALLLACSSAVAHDLVRGAMGKRLSSRAQSWVSVGSTWIIGGIALLWAFSPPALITQFYTAAIGLLSASLFVPTIAGFWWRRANLAGGLAALWTGAVVYLVCALGPIPIPLAPIVIALPASAMAMWLGGRLGRADAPEHLARVERLHHGAGPDPSREADRS
ncbi:MAG: sodium:solute symporter family protein [Myxococcales bacterium FL481]|nr:MAG: sodium:solute symporter family protein [Myxococcales bacterium FL481]